MRSTRRPLPRRSRGCGSTATTSTPAPSCQWQVYVCALSRAPVSVSQTTRNTPGVGDHRPAMADRPAPRLELDGADAEMRGRAPHRRSVRPRRRAHVADAVDLDRAVRVRGLDVDALGVGEAKSLAPAARSPPRCGDPGRSGRGRRARRPRPRARAARGRRRGGAAWSEIRRWPGRTRVAAGGRGAPTIPTARRRARPPHPRRSAASRGPAGRAGCRRRARAFRPASSSRRDPRGPARRATARRHP